MNNSQPRVILWAVPRSISTAFFRAVMNKSNVKVLLEPFAAYYHFGKERISKRYLDKKAVEGASFQEIKEKCEDPLSGYDAVFVKDMAYYLSEKLESEECLPIGYKHTFMIRDPRKSVRSLYKMSVNTQLTGWDYFDPQEVGYKDLYRLFKLVTEELGQNAIVVDADDMVQNPEKLLRKYCEVTGLGFEDSMLNWNKVDLSIFQGWLPWFEGALTTSSFQNRSDSPSDELPKEVDDAIENAMPYYNQLYARKLQI